VVPCLRAPLGDGRNRQPTCAGEGFDRATIETISHRAGVSRRTFYDLYAGKEKAFASAHERAFAAFAERIEGACAAQPGWPRQVREALAAALDFAALSPDSARLLLADPFTAGPHAAALRGRLFDLLTPALRRGRALCAAESCPALEQALLGGLLAVVARRLRESRAASLPALAPALTRFVLSPYLGGVEADRIAGD
jgi:AcrR family transcriptional regulator